MPDIAKIHKHMQVVASDGLLVGTVAELLGVEIVLANAGNETRYTQTVPLGWVTSVDEAVHLTKSSEEIRQRAANAQGIS